MSLKNWDVAAKKAGLVRTVGESDETLETRIIVSNVLRLMEECSPSTSGFKPIGRLPMHVKDMRLGSIDNPIPLYLDVIGKAYTQ